MLSARNARVNCVQYGVFTRMLRACNAAIPVARTVGLPRQIHIVNNIIGALGTKKEK